MNITTYSFLVENLNKVVRQVDVSVFASVRKRLKNSNQGVCRDGQNQGHRGEAEHF